MKTTTTILTLLMAMIMSTMTAFAQWKNNNLSLSSVAEKGVVTTTSEQLSRAALILKAEGVVEAADADYYDLAKRSPATLKEFKAMDARTLEKELLPAMAETMRRLATGVVVEYPDTQGELDRIIAAVRKIKVVGPTGPTTETEIREAYRLTIAALEKRLKCSNPAPAQPAPAPTSAQPPAAVQPPTPVQPLAAVQPKGSLPAPAPTSAQPPAAAQPPTPVQPAVSPPTPPQPAQPTTQAQKARAALANLPPPPTPVGTDRKKQ